MQQERLLARAFRIRLRAIVYFSKYPPSKPASIQFRRTPPMPSQRSTQGWWTIFLSLLYLFYVRLNLCMPSLERAPWPLALNIDTRDRCPLFRQTYCGHNIEFSCPAASKRHYMELPGCIHRSTRPHRGQLQRFVLRHEIIQSLMELLLHPFSLKL